ncbi:MAG TPA: M28 family peptidase [Flavobacterium sp.]|jgi:hypothetical protein
MSKIKFLLFCVFIGSFGHAQSYVPFYGQVAEQVNEETILTNLTAFENFGVKYRGTAAQANTLSWLRAQYISYGYSESQLTEDVFTYGGSTCKNLVVTKMGTTYPNIFVIIDGHYDTVNGPGTNDNGSGTTIILEAARLLRNIPTEYSIKFIHFSGEEDGLIGSQHYVDNVVNSTSPKMNIRLLLNLDQVGGIAGMANNTVTCERDTGMPFSNNAASTSMTNQLANCIELYSPLETVIASAYASDYMPFENNGEVISGLYETNESPFPHTPNDLLVNMDPEYVYNIAKGTTGAMLHFAVACTNCNLGTADATNKDFILYPNPAHNLITLHKGTTSAESTSLKFTNVFGQEVYSISLNATLQIENIDVSHLVRGAYFVEITTGQDRHVQKLLIE